MPHCAHEDSSAMPIAKGRKTALCRCRTCNRDFDHDTGLLVEWTTDAGYVYASSRRPVP